MAIIDPMQYASWDNIDEAKEPDFSPVLLAALNTEDDLIGQVAIGKPTTQRKVQCLQKDLGTNKVTANDALTNSASDVTLTLASGMVATAHVHVGCVLTDMETANSEFLESLFVTAVDNSVPSAPVLTLERDYGSMLGAPVAHASDAVYKMVESAQEASRPDEDRTRDKTTLYNITQIYPSDIAMSRNTLKSAWRNVPDVFKESLEDRAIELRKQMAYNLIHGVRSAAPSGSVTGTMGGLFWWIIKGASAARYDTTSEAWDLDVASAMLDDTADLGVTGNLALCVGPTLYKASAPWTVPFERRDYTPTPGTVGRKAPKTIMSKEGIEAELIMERNLPGGCALMVDKSRMWLKPFVDAAWVAYITELGVGGVDAKSARLLAEWTLEVRNPAEAFALHTNLT